MLAIKSIRDAQVEGKRVLLRVDYNVPLQDGVVVDDARIKATLPTLEFLRDHNATSITIAAHVGRPEGRVVEELHIAPVAKRLRELFNGRFEILENVRFNPGEELNDPAFARELASHGDIFVNDAFADAHRAHSSIVGVAKLLPSYAGLLMEKEVAHLSAALTPPPGSLAILGGAKFETKIPLLKKLVTSYDTVMLGGALANEMLRARGAPVGESLVSDASVPAELAGNAKIQLPIDVALETTGSKAGRTTMINDVRAQEKIVDVGPDTAKLWSEKISAAPFVLWNGPVGIYEETYTEGTDALARAIAESKCKAVVGGGDTNVALKKFNFDKSRVFVSTGGGAMLEFLADGTLPGLEVLKIW